MDIGKSGQVAVIFVSRRTPDDAAGYARAADEMLALAQSQPGYVGVHSARDATGFGITVSYWESEAAAKAWRNHPRHSEIRDAGRALWYQNYHTIVADVTRSYDWSRNVL